MMLSTRRSRAALFVAAVAFASFAAISACGTDTFTTGEGSDASTGDEGSVDASLRDAVPGDSANDANVSFCTSIQNPPYFCADFDEGDHRTAYLSGELQLLFTDTVTTLATLQTEDAGQSPPANLAAHADTVPGGESGFAYVTAVLPNSSKTHFAFDCDLRIDQIGDISASSPALLIGTLSVADNGNVTTTAYKFNFYSGDLHIDIVPAGGFATSVDLGAPPTIGTWTHLSIDVTLGASGLLHAKFGAVSSAAASSYTTSLQSTPAVTLGISASGPSNAITVSYDNVTLVADTSDAG